MAQHEIQTEEGAPVMDLQSMFAAPEPRPEPAQEDNPWYATKDHLGNCADDYAKTSALLNEDVRDFIDTRARELLHSSLLTYGDAKSYATLHAIVDTIVEGVFLHALHSGWATLTEKATADRDAQEKYYEKRRDDAMRRMGFTPTSKPPAAPRVASPGQYL